MSKFWSKVVVNQFCSSFLIVGAGTVVGEGAGVELGPGVADGSGVGLGGGDEP